MARVIVVTSGKGGVGKTTITANLGMALARMGRSLSLIDADIGLRNLDLLLGLENRVVYTAMEALSGECRLEQALISDKREKNLMFLPAAQHRNRHGMNLNHMREIISLLEAKFEYILIDSPAGIENGFENAISSAREALVVTTPEIASVRDADRVIGLLEAQGIHHIHLIINRTRPLMVQENDMMSVADVKEVLAIPLIGVIPEDEKVIISTNKGEPLVLEENLSLPGLSLENTARRIDGQNVEFLNFEEFYNTPVNKLKKIFSKASKTSSLK